MIKLVSRSKPENPKTPYELAQNIHDYLQQQQPWNSNLRPTRLLTSNEEELNLSLPFEQYSGTVFDNLVNIIRYEMEERFRSLPEESKVVFYIGTNRGAVPEVMFLDKGLSHYNPQFNLQLRGGIDALIDAAMSPLPGGIELGVSHTSAQVSAAVSNGYGSLRVPFNKRVIIETILLKDSVVPILGCVSYGVVIEQVPLSSITGIYLADKDGRWVRFRVRDGELMDPENPYSKVQTSMPLTFPYNPASIPILRNDLHQEPPKNSKLLAEIEEKFGPLLQKKIIPFA